MPIKKPPKTDKELTQLLLTALSAKPENRRGIVINNALTIALNDLNLPEPRLRQLREYTLAMLAVPEEHVNEDLLSERELLTVFLAAALYMQANILG